jgi:hypothetical protein
MRKSAPGVRVGWSSRLAEEGAARGSSAWAAEAAGFGLPGGVGPDWACSTDAPRLSERLKSIDAAGTGERMGRMLSAQLETPHALACGGRQ